MSNVQKLRCFRPRHSSRDSNFARLCLVTTLFMAGFMLSVTPLFWNILAPSSIPSAKAAPALNSAPSLIHVPFFTTAVPFNQTAIFWFGDITSSDNYTDVRIGYNASELYIDLRIIDRYLWYDPNVQAPNITQGDNATIYLSTTLNSDTLLMQHSYKFQTGVNGNIQRSNYQLAFSGNGTAWMASRAPFTADYWWRGKGFNGSEDKGWSTTYHIPFTSLGLPAAPPQGTLWKLAIRVHNRDDAANTPIPDKWWPQSANETNPSGWGELSFGLPAYQSPRTSNTATYTIRNKLNNQTVTDAMVGGALGCGSNVSDVWTQLGSQAYPGAVDVTIENEADMSDWNCFSKLYVTFPLSALPAGKGVANAKVTLYEYANAGVQGQPNPSYIQVATANADWNPATISWNTAPQMQENITSILVNTKTQPVIPWPGLAITWDISRAAAEAYAAGQPLRLVFYSTDNQYNGGKYFTSSSVGDWDANGRPTLQVSLGNTILTPTTPVPGTGTGVGSGSGATPGSITVISSGHGGQQTVSSPEQPSNTPQVITAAENVWRRYYLAPLVIVPASLLCLFVITWRRKLRRQR